MLEKINDLSSGTAQIMQSEKQNCEEVKGSLAS